MKLEYKKEYEIERDQITSIGPVGSGCDIEISNDVTTCTNLKKVTLPFSVQKINQGAFYCCQSLTEVILPDSIKYIGDNAFRESMELKKINLPNSIIELGRNIFFNCESLEKLEIPSSVEIISDSICGYCPNLKEIKINAKCKLPKHLLYGCNELKKVYITKESFTLSPDFIEMYKNKLEIEIINKSLDELLDEGKSLREIREILKENDEITK